MDCDRTLSAHGAVSGYVEIIIRPQHLKIDFDRSGKGPNPTIQDGVPARGKVCMSRFIGKEIKHIPLDEIRRPDGTNFSA